MLTQASLKTSDLINSPRENASKSAKKVQHGFDDH